MASFFRFTRPPITGTRRPRLGFFLSSRIKNVVGTAAGVATVTGVARAIAITAGTAAGVGAATGVGRTIKPTVGSAAGSATVSGVGKAFVLTVATASGTCTVTGITERKQITSTRILHKPVDYALAGDQDSPVRRGRAGGRGLRHTFGE